MNYRHIYHAGNFADVIKHCILIELFAALKRKDAPFCYLDTHAGIGLYPVSATEMQKKQEYAEGVARLMGAAEQFPVLASYIEIIKAYNPKGDLRVYPGSPAIAKACLRPDDRMQLCELHPKDYETLNEQWPKSRKLGIHPMNGYTGLKAFLPPLEKRGVVMIDPPFEKPDEFNTIEQSLKQALKTWRGGHFMIWYPIKNKARVSAFHRNLKALGEVFTVEFHLNAKAQGNELTACGVSLINPPWQVDGIIEKQLCPAWAKLLGGRCVVNR
ncbi:MAG: 23S rRNA (adenine(2030)-N(6))-methyltransferase RlmJ [Gammaproteobacteria bacterium CG11_big_fil_rev_8_21_14_0_20_46_22]|nr:MAG: 23S rRNA (adenine(2030)-N(6))-methyltransferase RlmJ [Gammaproteobacteria bacterium CG12_big_fil_rev_8_21_14_0_65_46_12]PIR10646.1 MAG: 23S rRNA (adenine(2030)-N(6))-methyltransferase RlmJ [Gammaproteobacteria bacterium CG11_big_fil_rev_8_21_14_0_20_46_22]